MSQCLINIKIINSMFTFFLHSKPEIQYIFWTGLAKFQVVNSYIGLAATTLDSKKLYNNGDYYFNGFINKIHSPCFIFIMHMNRIYIMWIYILCVCIYIFYKMSTAETYR